MEALTPSHLIYGRRLKTFPSVAYTDQDDDPNYLDHGKINERYQHLSKIINKWYDLWKREYLTSLREKFYGVSPNKPLPSELKEGDVVIVEGNGPRTEWPLGRVEKKYPGKDGRVRLVKLRMKSGTALRTIDKLVPLECTVENSESSDDVIPEEPANRPCRGSANRFRAKLRNLIDAGDL